MLDFSIPDALIEFMKGGGFKAFISFGLYLLEQLGKLYDSLFITKTSDLILDLLSDIIAFLPDDVESIINIFLDFFRNNVADWSIFGFPPAFLVVGGGLVMALVLALFKLVWGMVKTILDISL